MARKHPALVAQLLPVLCQWAGNIEDDPEWSNTPTEDVDDEEDLTTVGEQGLDRLANTLGGKLTCEAVAQAFELPWQPAAEVAESI